MNIAEKKQFVEALKERLDKAKIAILTDYKGLNVEAMTELRAKLREARIEYQVIKNTMLRLASDGTDIAPIRDSFVGPSAIALSFDDPVAPAKILTDFAKSNAKLEIKVGVMNGKVLDLSSIKALADLPSREQLLAMVLSTMNAVPTSLVTALSDVPRRMVNVLQAIKDQKEAA